MRAVILVPVLLLAACIQEQACPADARLCPDGTALSRNPETCEFPECPKPPKELAQEGGMCAGIAGIQCGSGLVCDIEQDSPDASGICVPVAGNACTDPRPDICTEEYMPVCGSDGVTYSNGCMACTNPKVLYWEEGQCPPEPMECTGKAPEVCTADYRPVCGDDGITYSNACNACAAGVKTYSEGQC